MSPLVHFRGALRSHNSWMGLLHLKTAGTSFKTGCKYYLSWPQEWEILKSHSNWCGSKRHIGIWQTYFKQSLIRNYWHSFMLSLYTCNHKITFIVPRSDTLNYDKGALIRLCYTHTQHAFNLIRTYQMRLASNLPIHYIRRAHFTSWQS